jgi:hypothetical protein
MTAFGQCSATSSPHCTVHLAASPEKRERPFLKAHLAQSLVFGVAVYLISALLVVFILGHYCPHCRLCCRDHLGLSRQPWRIRHHPCYY